MTATFFHGATVVVGDGATVISGAGILVEDGVITHLESGWAPAPDRPVHKVDLRGRHVMPTIINAHAHLGYLRGATTAREHFSETNVIDHLLRLAYHGVSVVQSLGTDRDGIEIGLRNRQLAGDADARLPLIRSAAQGIVASDPGGTNGGPWFASDVLLEVSTPGEARAAVRRLAEQRPDAIKVWIDDRNRTKPKLTEAVYSAAIDEANSLGIDPIAHVYYLDDAKGASRAGARALAHLVREPGPDGELIDIMRAHGTHAFTSMSIQGAARDLRWLDDPLLAESASAQVRSQMRALLETLRTDAPLGSGAAFGDEANAIIRESLRRNYDGGVPLVLSGDTGVLSQFFGFAEHRELEAMVDYGMSPQDAIASATSIPSRLLGLHDRGALAVGSRADFIVLEANPLDDIANSRRIVDVYFGGSALDRAGMRNGFISDGSPAL